MKTTKFKTLLILLLAILSSCAKEDSLNTRNSEIIKEGRKLLSLIEARQDFESRQLSYSLLSPEQRYSLWYAKLSDNAVPDNYTSVQIAKIIELRDYITAQTFNKGDQREIFYTVWFPNFVKETENIFSPTQFYLLFMTVSEQSELKKSNRLSTKTAPVECKCAVNSQYTCRSFAPSWPWGISVTYGKCEKIGSCTKTSSGCGALWDNECDGDTCPWESQST